MLNSAKKGGKLSLRIINLALNDENCGGEAILSLLPDNLYALYQLTQEASDIAQKLFNIQLGLQSTLFDKDIRLPSSENFDYYLNFHLETDTTIKPSDDSVLFNIEANVVTNKDGFKIDTSNPLISKFEELTGFNMDDMSAKVKAKFALLPDGEIAFTANPEKIEIAFTQSKEIGQTTVNAVTTFRAERNKRNIRKTSSTLSEPLETVKSLCNEYNESASKNLYTAAFVSAITALTLSTVNPNARAATAAATSALSLPMQFLFRTPVY